MIPLSEDVYRLGHDETCEIQIPAKAAHALTVFRRTGTVFVLNRTKLQIHLGKTPLAGGATAKWCPGATIVIDGVCLKLQCSSGRASDAASTVPESPYAASVTKAGSNVRKAAPLPEGRQPKSQRSQIVVIAACLMMIGLMLCLGKPLAPRHEEQFEQLAKLSVSLSNIAAKQNQDLPSGKRAEKLLDLLVRYRVSVVVEKESYTNVAKAEAEKFCHSIVRASKISDDEYSIVKQLRISDDELSIVKQLGAVLGQIQ